ncbi:FtsK/SpoIIIE domain-containing protein, partial [Phytoactinopolyspora endophytica]|uniref:FtsK/SpoIIIE domain-containing protein n=1 Tax=Phytoactinopolyspora endophytica TaxID=1642495 RepID=UPI00101C725D
MTIRYASDQINGDEYYTPRRPGDDDALFVSMFKVLALLAFAPVWLLWRHPIATTTATAAGWVLLVYGPVALAVVLLLVAVGLVGWRIWHPTSFARFISCPVRSRWRGWRLYRRDWTFRMHMCELSKGWGAQHFVPHIVRVRSDAHADHVKVKLLSGQTPADIAGKADQLAATFGATACQVRTISPSVVMLHFIRTNPLWTSVKALEPASRVNLEALPVGVREDARAWRLRLLGTHVLVAGATGSGKGSVIWSTIRAVAPAIRDGWVQVWSVDPKGGIELAPGAAMFARFVHEPEPIVDLVEQAAELIQERAARMRGRARLHRPTTAEPFVLLVVDEVAFLTAYMPDRKLSKRLTSALSVVLSQGRAVGVSVLAAVQDPRKETLGIRDLFPTRVALRLTESEQVDMVLGQGARERGAECHRVPETTPGMG